MTQRTQIITRRAQQSEKVPWNIADIMVIAQAVFPAMLYVPGVQPIRIFLRLGQYLMTLAILFYLYQVQGKKTKIPTHPACLWLVLASGYGLLMLLHPETNSLLAGLAEIMLYVSIAAPVFWTWAYVKTPSHLNRLLWLFLITNSVSCFVGVMQVRDPARWLPREISSVFQDEDSVAGLIYEGVGGKIIIRPPGLSDTPGAVCTAGTFVLCAGIIFGVSAKRWWQRYPALAFSALGGAAIFYSLVRTAILISVGMVLVYMLVQLFRGKGYVAFSVIIRLVAVVGCAFLYSLIQGGDVISDRFSSLFAEDPATVYYENRGNQVADGIAVLLPKYPLGGGLGRFGMINTYFGKAASVEAPPIWVEIQWNAWLVDGGVLVMVLYPIAIIVTFMEQFKIAFYHPNQEVRELATVIIAINSGAAALCFSFLVFLSPIGIQFWFLSGAIHSVAYHTRGNPSTKMKLEPPKDVSSQRLLKNAQ